MKTLFVIGLTLIMLGGVILAYQGFTYIARITALDFGLPLVESAREDTVPLLPIVSVLLLATGFALTVAGVREPA